MAVLLAGRSQAAAGARASAPSPTETDAVGWRRDGSSAFPGTRPPLRWSRTNPAGLVWRTELPPGNASPIVVDGRVFLTAEPTRILAVDLETGRILWERRPSMVDALSGDAAAAAQVLLDRAEQAAGALELLQPKLVALKRRARSSRGGPVREELEALTAQASALKAEVDAAAHLATPPTGDIIGYASATPVSDGRALYAVFGHGLVVSYALAGTLRWARRLGPPVRPMQGYAEGHAASPLLVDGRLIVALGSLQALDPATGRELWKSVPYPHFGTPAVTLARGRHLLATPAGELVDAADGKVLSRAIEGLLYIGAVAAPERLFFVGALSDERMHAEGGAPAAAWALESPAKPRRLWSARMPRERVYATPLLAGGHLFVVDAGGRIRVLDAGSGRQVREFASLGRGEKGFANPVLAGGRVYVSLDDGTTRVFSAAPPFDELAQNELDPGRASPFFVGETVVIRTESALLRLREVP